MSYRYEDVSGVAELLLTSDGKLIRIVFSAESLFFRQLLLLIKYHQQYLVFLHPHVDPKRSLDKTRSQIRRLT